MSDEDGLAMEEEEVIRMQKEKFKKLSVADYGIEEADDGEATIVEREMLAKGTTKSAVNKQVHGYNETIYRINKDNLNMIYFQMINLTGLAELLPKLPELKMGTRSIPEYFPQRKALADDISNYWETLATPQDSWINVNTSSPLQAHGFPANSRGWNSASITKRIPRLGRVLPEAVGSLTIRKVAF